jgi:hypothetical protein
MNKNNYSNLINGYLDNTNWNHFTREHFTIPNLLKEEIKEEGFYYTENYDLQENYNWGTRGKVAFRNYSISPPQPSGGSPSPPSLPPPQPSGGGGGHHYYPGGYNHNYHHRYYRPYDNYYGPHYYGRGENLNFRDYFLKYYYDYYPYFFPQTYPYNMPYTPSDFWNSIQFVINTFNPLSFDQQQKMKEFIKFIPNLIPCASDNCYTIVKNYIDRLDESDLNNVTQSKSFLADFFNKFRSELKRTNVL